jgi:hypothetical protein
MDRSDTATIKPNYLYHFAYQLAARYSDDSFDVHDYEIYNEPGSYSGWHWGWAGNDTYKPDTFYYFYKGYDTTDLGRADLYVTACSVAFKAIKAADPTARIYAPAITNINADYDGKDIGGNIFLNNFYQKGGGSYADIITYHWYPSPDNKIYQDSGYHKFIPREFIADYDTVCDIMRNYGDRFKPVWQMKVVSVQWRVQIHIVRVRLNKPILFYKCI